MGNFFFDHEKKIKTKLFKNENKILHANNYYQNFITVFYQIKAAGNFDCRR